MKTSDTKVVVCGDSWMTTDIRYPDKHFSEILSNKYGFNVINLARGGMSNIGICFQLQQAVELDPQIIIFNETEPDRTSFPIGKFKINEGLKNIRYTDSVSGSCKNILVGDKTSPVIDDVLETLNGNSCKYDLSSEQKTAIKFYTAYLYDFHFNAVIQNWMIKYWENEIANRGISVLNFRNEINYKTIDDSFSYDSLDKYDAVFHTDFDFQKKLANALQQLIIKKLSL